ncbi:MAG: trypsin-like serine protease [Actinomycetaceae bacterium]|nr:trypsin-like serine protease [Actinomycetaceae bacterium]
MKKKVTLGVSVFVVLGLIATAVFWWVSQKEANAAGTRRDTHVTTVQLKITNLGGSCSGVFVGPDLILTAKHCVTRSYSNYYAPSPEHLQVAARNIEVYASHMNRGGKVLGVAQVIWAQPGDWARNPDVALLRISGYRTNNYASVSSAKVNVGERLEVCGMNDMTRQRFDANYPRDYNYCGDIQAAEVQSWGNYFIMSRSVTAPGDSGGPLYNSRNQVVGLVAGGNVTTQSSASLYPVLGQLKARGVVVR